MPFAFDLFDSPTLADLPGTTEPAHAFTYDGRGRKIVEDANNPAIRITYQYDALGRLTRAGYPDGRYAWFFYDKDSRLTDSSPFPVSLGRTR